MTSFQSPQVLVTGGCGRIGLLLVRAAADRYTFTLLDVRPPPPDVGLPVVHADITDFAAIRDHFHGIDTVVHLAADPRPDAPWESLHPNNIVGTYNVLRAAHTAGCRRVVFASSLHAVLGYSRDVQVYSKMPPCPDTLYGATKAWGERLASHYASECGMSVICVRIGALTAVDSPRLTPWNASLDIVVTPRDLVKLLICCLDAPASVRYGVFHGISGNRRRRFDIAEAHHVLGYQPQDDAYALARRNFRGIARRISGAWRSRIKRLYRTF